MTIHITPEPEFSYVSFESNIPEASYEEVIRRVLDTFKPGKFVVTIFANKESVAAETPRELEQADYLNFDGEWLRDDVQYCRFKNYDLTCAFYSKFPSWWFTDGSSVPLKRGTDRAIKSSPLSRPNFQKKSVTHTDPLIISRADKNTKQSTEFSSQTRNFGANVVNENTKSMSQALPHSCITNNNNENRSIAFNLDECRSKRSASSPQLTMKPLTRSKVYRKTSLKSSTIKLTGSEQETLSLARITKIGGATKASIAKTGSKSDRNGKEPIDDIDKINRSINDSKVKWNTENVHITCNPLSNPYPYSTPCHKIDRDKSTDREQPDEEPKSHSCGSFLPILSLIPQTMVSFQYLSPKMKFSWWRNKISWRHA